MLKGLHPPSGSGRQPRVRYVYRQYFYRVQDLTGVGLAASALLLHRLRRKNLRNLWTTLGLGHDIRKRTATKEHVLRKPVERRQP